MKQRKQKNRIDQQKTKKNKIETKRNKFLDQFKNKEKKEIEK